MKKHTTFKVGGPADIFVEAGSEDDIIKSLEIFKNERVPYFIMGNGSNLLVSDKGFRGAVIKTGLLDLYARRFKSAFR